METLTHTKTKTTVNPTTETFTINIKSDMNADGTTTPSIFKAQIANAPITVDNASGKEGELLLSYEGSEVAGDIDVDGNLYINPENDDETKYSLGGTDNADLIYIEEE